MDDANKNPASLPPDEDLTEVRKPASLLIAQFFLFPLIIIGICIGIFLFFGYVTYDQKTPSEYLSEIRSGTGTQRWQAAFELSNIVKSDPDRAGTAEFVDSLMAAYKDSPDEDIRARRYVALILGELKERRAVPLLVEGLQRDERLKAADWNKEGAFQWFRPSLDQIRDDLIQNQIYTLWALGSIGDNSAVPAVLELTANEEASVRKVAAYILGVFKDDSAAERLRVLLNDSEEDVRMNSALALAQMNDAGGAELLMKFLDPMYVEGLQGMSVSEKAEVTINALTALSMLKYGPAREKMEFLGESASVLAVRNAAMEALKKY